MINSNLPNFEIEKKVQNKFLLTLQLSSSEQSMQSQSPLQRWDIIKTVEATHGCIEVELNILKFFVCAEVVAPDSPVTGT